MSIRVANIHDAKEISRIYKFYVENTHISFEHIAPSAEEFEKRIETTLENYPFLVYEIDNKIIGYTYASRHIERASYGWNAVMTVYVDSDYHKKGIGTKLYKKLIEMLCKQNVQNVYGCITSGNDKSMEMHKKLGFEVNGVFHKTGYKNGQWLDMTWVEKTIGEYKVPPENFLPFSKI